MPISASTVTGAGGIQRFVCDLISTATTDGDTSATLTIAHGFLTQLGTNVTNATNRLMLNFQEIANVGGLSQWYAVSLDTTNAYISKPINQAASAAAGGQCRLHIQCVSSQVE